MTSSTRYTPLFETTTFPFPDGIDILALWRDNDIGRKYIQCYICHKVFLVNERRYPMTLGRHRNNATCPVCPDDSQNRTKTAPKPHLLLTSDMWYKRLYCTISCTICQCSILTRMASSLIHFLSISSHVYSYNESRGVVLGGWRG